MTLLVLDVLFRLLAPCLQGLPLNTPTGIGIPWSSVEDQVWLAGVFNFLHSHLWIGHGPCGDLVHLLIQEAGLRLGSVDQVVAYGSQPLW
jgi:hypothetical protein